MKISDEGLRLIKSFEGYHTRLKDGSCAAYLCPAGVATIGFGCTEGVKLGMVWSEAEAEAALLREIAKFEDAVSRNVTVEINQNEFDAMVSLAYNIGAAAFGRSTVLRRLNKGDRAGAAKAFNLWNKGGGRVLAGLVSRRMRESALFLKPAAKPDDPIMPQAVTASKEPPKPATVAVGTCAAGGLALPFIPSIPAPPLDAVSSVAGWQNAAETVRNFTSSPAMWIAICGILIAVALPWMKERFS
jgi:lysozyme